MKQAGAVVLFRLPQTILEINKPYPLNVTSEQVNDGMKMFGEALKSVLK